MKDEINTNENKKVVYLRPITKDICMYYFAFKLNQLLFEEIEKEAKNKKISVNTLVSEALEKYIKVTCA